jgi:Altered inheritance of mitochondria protein 21
MSAPSAPVIPPRPSRSPQTLNVGNTPSIPPRPTNRRLDRSVSPARDSYAPSPFNAPPGLSRTTSNDYPSRPPSVTIPSLGEEGIEYEELSAQNLEPETRNVGSDLKLHAPKPSLPVSSAKARVQVVTRTDSGQAAAAGFGKTSASPALDEELDQRSRSLYSKPGDHSRAESSTASSSRRQSMQFEEEQGIPEIGQRVPMLANAGDVQAPSPAPPRSASASGQRLARHHQRTRSGREVFLPPGSYGLHGHGVHAADRFEKAWYDKHPDELAREEQGQYGPAITERSTWALSSDDLNRLVRSSSANDSSLGESLFLSTPTLYTD